MSEEQTTLGWYDRNEGRLFPLADDASPVGLPYGLILDLVIITPRTYDPSSVYLSQVAGFGSGIVISFSVDGVGVVAMSTIPSSHTRFTSYMVSPVNDSDVTGRIVIGQPELVSQLSAQSISFTLSSGKLAPVCVRPRLQGLSKVVIKDFAGNEYDLTEDVTLVAGENMSMSVDGQVITLDAQGGLIINDRFAGNTDGTGRNPVKSINGVAPDSNGNIVINGSDCIEITAGVNSINISDTCADPCCGCEELERVTDGFENLGNSQSELKQFLSTLLVKVQQLESSFQSSNIP